jgi:hypothetical protein
MPLPGQLCQSGTVRGSDPTNFGYILWDLVYPTESAKQQHSTTELVNPSAVSGGGSLGDNLL